VATATEAGTDSASVKMATFFEAFLIAFETPFERVHKGISFPHWDKKEETLRFLPESLLPESMFSSL
jgi:hypothetical protein